MLGSGGGKETVGGGGGDYIFMLLERQRGGGETKESKEREANWKSKTTRKCRHFSFERRAPVSASCNLHGSHYVSGPKLQRVTDE